MEDAFISTGTPEGFKVDCYKVNKVITKENLLVTENCYPPKGLAIFFNDMGSKHFIMIHV